MSELLLYTVRDRVVYITMNRPEKRNALSPELIGSLKDALRKAETDVNGKIIVIEGSGEAFCAGADLGYLQQLQKNTDEENLADSHHLMELFQLINGSKKIIISKVNGAALAGGCGLATTCDFCFASPGSTFGYTEVKIGFIPAMVMVFLVRMVGERVARRLLLSGEIINAEEACRLQLINKVINAEELDSEVHAFATQLAKNTSSQSVEMVKEMLNKVGQLDIQAGLSYAATMNVKARSGEDCRKGISAFLNKEKLTW